MISHLSSLQESDHSQLGKPQNNDTPLCKPLSPTKKGRTRKRYPSLQSEKWHTRLDELIEFIKKFGHSYVPNNYSPNPKLARWVKKQRYHYHLLLQKKQSSMTFERIKILENIGFVWDPQEEAWQERIAELLEYKRENGNCEVPSKYQENPQLATWVKRQRRQYKLYLQGHPSNMTMQRIAELTSYGFRWKIRNSKACRKKVNVPEIAIDEPVTEEPEQPVVQNNIFSPGIEYFTLVDALSLADVSQELCDDLILDEYAETLKAMSGSDDAPTVEHDPFMETLSDLSDIEEL